MNRERIRALAEVIERQPHAEVGAESGFNMNNYRHKCGTPSSIAGWAVFLFAPGRVKESNFFIGQWVLDITNNQAHELFCTDGFTDNLDSITPAMAAKTLRNLAETGVVAWSAK